MITINEERPMWMRPKSDEEIVICKTCRGSGLIGVSNDNPSYEGPWIEKCYACSGFGRVAKLITTEHVVLTDEILKRNKGNY